MAVINSLAIGKAVKSAGNLTYKVSRGRTIASQRITSNSSDTVAQRAQRNRFGRSAIAMQLLSQYIDLMFEKSRYGSSRNNFIKKNGLIDFGTILLEVQAGVRPLRDGFAYTFHCDLDGTPMADAARYTSFGSGAFIVKNVNTVGKVRLSNIDDIDVRMSSSLTVNPTSGVDVSMVEIRVAGFVNDDENNDPPMIVRRITPDEEGIEELAALGIECTVNSDGTSGVVSSIDVEVPEVDASNSLVGSLYAITVAISGKIATTAGLWLVKGLEPLP